jgi:hypothetical protein
MAKTGICPILTTGNNAVPCIQDKCAFWEELYQKCGYICDGDKVADAMSQMLNVLNDMKNKL